MNKQESESLVEHIQLEYLGVIILELVEVECPRCLMLEKTKVLTRLENIQKMNTYLQKSQGGSGSYYWSEVNLGPSALHPEH